MTRIHNIYTTISQGRLHIAADDKYVGSIDSYNNCITQFFAWVFRKSIIVDFDGKLRCVNKKSYTTFVLNYTKVGSIVDIAQKTIVRPILESQDLPEHALRMRDVIAKVDSLNLFKKLAQAISCGDTYKAKLLIGKGADLEHSYFQSKYGVSFYSDSEKIDNRSAYNFIVFQGSPLLQAAKKGYYLICEMLLEFGASSSQKASEYVFRREITSVKENYALTSSFEFVPHHYHITDSSGASSHFTKHDVHLRPRYEKRVTVNTVDQRCQLANWEFNLDSRRLVRAESS